MQHLCSILLFMSFDHFRPKFFRRKKIRCRGYPASIHEAQSCDRKWRNLRFPLSKIGRFEFFSANYVNDRQHVAEVGTFYGISISVFVFDKFALKGPMITATSEPVIFATVRLIAQLFAPQSSLIPWPWMKTGGQSGVCGRRFHPFWLPEYPGTPEILLPPLVARSWKQGAPRVPWGRAHPYKNTVALVVQVFFPVLLFCYLFCNVTEINRA